MKSTIRWSGFGVFVALSIGLVACAGSRPPEPTEEDEKVNIGYGSVDKDNITGSIATVDVDEARKSSATSVAEMLSGRVAGVDVRQVGHGLQITIRGRSSIRGDTQPLFVVDGVPMNVPDGILPISPSDIKAISVLKDAGSTAIYGTRGANGVILIETRRGN